MYLNSLFYKYILSEGKIIVSLKVQAVNIYIYIYVIKLLVLSPHQNNKFFLDFFFHHSFFLFLYFINKLLK